MWFSPPFDFGRSMGETEPGAREAAGKQPQRGVLAVTVRVIQTISSAEMMISAMPMIVSTKKLLHHRIPIGGPTCAGSCGPHDRESSERAAPRASP
jgi:hypothetical protein